MQRASLLFLILIALITSSACQLDNREQELGIAINETPADPDQSNLPGETVQIRFAAYDYERPLYEPLIQRFNDQQTEIRVKFVTLDPLIIAESDQPLTIDQMVRQVMSASDTALIDFATMDQVANGYFYDLTSFIDADQTFQRADFYPGALDALTQNDQIYMLPRSIRLSLLAYNKDLWAAQGLPAPQPDWTWADILGASRQLAQRRVDTIDQYGLIDLGGAMALHGELDRLGVQLDAPSTQLNQDEIVEAVENVATWSREGVILTRAAAEQGTAGDPSFIQTLIREQRVGLWPSDLFTIDTNTPQSFEIGLIPLPDSFLPIFGTTPDGYVISSGTQHPQAAWRWLSFVSQQLTTEANTSITESRLPARISLAEQSGFWSRLDESTAIQLRAVIEQSASQGGRAELNNLALSLLRDTILAVESEQVSVTEALRDAQNAYIEQLAAAQQTPSPTVDRNPIMLATPVPDDRSVTQTTIRFRVLAVEADAIRSIAQTFQGQRPDIHVQIQTEENDATTNFATIAAATDCFAWEGLLNAEDIQKSLDLQPLIDADADFAHDDYALWLLEPFQRDGKLYGLPYAAMFRVLAYNQELFDRLKITPPNAPWTFNDFAVTAQQLTNSNGTQTETYGFVPIDTLDSMLFFLHQLGVNPIRNSSETIEMNFTDPQTIAGIRRYVDMLTQSTPKFENDAVPQSDQQIRNLRRVSEGQAAMWLTFGVPQQSAYDFAIGVAPPPLNSDGELATDIPFISLHISSQTQHAQACWDWLKHLSNTIPQTQGWFPARRSTAESNEFAAQTTQGSSEIYQVYEDAYRRVLPMDEPLQTTQPSRTAYFWLQRAVARAANGADLNRELNEAQTITQQYLNCVQNGTASETCATQVDPTYQGLAGP